MVRYQTNSLLPTSARVYFTKYTIESIIMQIQHLTERNENTTYIYLYRKNAFSCFGQKVVIFMESYRLRAL